MANETVVARTDRLMGHDLPGFKGAIYDPHQVLRKQREEESLSRKARMQSEIDVPRRLADLAAKYDALQGELSGIRVAVESLLARHAERQTPPKRRGRPRANAGMEAESPPKS